MIFSSKLGNCDYFCPYSNLYLNFSFKKWNWNSLKLPNLCESEIIHSDKLWNKTKLYEGANFKFRKKRRLRNNCKLFIIFCQTWQFSTYSSFFQILPEQCDLLTGWRLNIRSKFSLPILRKTPIRIKRKKTTFFFKIPKIFCHKINLSL